MSYDADKFLPIPKYKVSIGLLGREGWANNHVEKWFSQFKKRNVVCLRRVLLVIKMRGSEMYFRKRDHRIPLLSYQVI